MNLTKQIINETYVNPTENFNAFRIKYVASIEIFQFVSSFFGIIGYILLFSTMIKNSAFSDPCFICYKGIFIISPIYSISEFVVSLYRLHVELFVYLPLTTYFRENFFFSWFRQIGCNAFYIFSLHVTYDLIIFLSFQRGVACIMPSKLKYLNQKWICLSFTLFTIISKFLYCLPMVIAQNILWNPEKRRYNLVPPTSTYIIYEKFISYIFIIQAVALMIGSIFAIAGFLKANAHK